MFGNLTLEESEGTMNVDKKTIKIAGVLYLIIVIGSILGGVFSEMYIQSHHAGVVAEDSMNIPDWLYRVGFVIYLVVYLSDMATALVLYILLKPVNNGLALLAAFFRFAEATILGINMLNHYAAFLILSGADNLTAFDPNQLNGVVQFLLDAHRSGYLIGQVFFGFHCFFLGYLLFKSGYFPKVLGVFLIAASFGYLIESFAYFLLPNHEAVETVTTWIVALPAFLAELSFTYWLLFKNSDVEMRYNQISASAR